MAGFSKVLCALDFSSLGDGALEVARTLAGTVEAPLALAHVYETPWYAYPEIEIGAMTGGDSGAVEAWFREKAGRLLERRLAGCGADVKGDVLEGTPIHKVLSEHAQSVGADLLVVGTHGRGAPGRYLLGSVAETLARTATIPLLIVPEGAAAGFQASQTVLCPTDFSEPSEDGVRYAADVAHTLGAPFEILHVEESASDAEHARESERLVGYEVDNLKGRHPELSVRGGVRFGEPSSTIVEYAREHDAKMIVMGTRGTKGLARVLIGSVTDRVIRKAPMPVLVIPPPSE